MIIPRRGIVLGDVLVEHVVEADEQDAVGVGSRVGVKLKHIIFPPLDVLMLYISLTKSDRQTGLFVRSSLSLSLNFITRVAPTVSTR